MFKKKFEDGCVYPKKVYFCRVFLRHQMAVVAQLVRVPDCGSVGRRFESDLPPESLTKQQKSADRCPLTFFVLARSTLRVMGGYAASFARLSQDFRKTFASPGKTLASPSKHFYLPNTCEILACPCSTHALLRLNYLLRGAHGEASSVRCIGRMGPCCAIP